MNFERLSGLTTGVSGFTERVSGTPMKESDWTDIAQAIGKCTPEQAALLRAIYLHDVSATRSVVETLAAGKACIRASALLSRDLAFSTLRAFAAMRPCEHCQGEGRVRMQPSMQLDMDSGEWIAVKGGWKDCSWCRADGYTHIHPLEVQRMLGVSLQVWDMLLAQPFAEAYEQLREWHKNGQRIIAGVA